jgi:hypothetical protein
MLSSTLQLFLEKVEKTRTCWLWNAYRNHDGYGRARHNGKQTGAHRVSWQLHNGPIPEGLHVCHHCDNPPCVNPAHLFLGTHRDNCVDRMLKGRGGDRKGVKHGRAKLTNEQVHEIRRLRLEGVHAFVIAKQFGISWANVYRIASKNTWTHI